MDGAEIKDIIDFVIDVVYSFILDSVSQLRSSYKDLPYEVVGDALHVERKNIIYKEKDYWKDFLHKIIPFLNSDEEEQ